MTDWSLGVKKEFFFNNVNSYSKYKISTTAPGGVPVISEMEMMESIVTAPTAPTNLAATAGNAKVDLK